MDSFTITKINKDNGEITVKYSFTDEPQVIGGLPLNDKEELCRQITNFGINLKSQLDKKTVAKEVEDLVSKPLDLVVEKEEENNGTVDK